VGILHVMSCRVVSQLLKPLLSFMNVFNFFVAELLVLKYAFGYVQPSYVHLSTYTHNLKAFQMTFLWMLMK
jgi:hypothetical protein